MDTGGVSSQRTGCVATFCVGGFFTARAYWQKKGAFIRGDFGVSRSITTDQSYVSHVMLENLKDRAVVVFGIYLRFSNGFMIELETFDAPHVLRPFEVERRNYDPID